MSNFGNLISSLQQQFSPAMVVVLLFGAATVLGILLGASLVGLITSPRQRRRHNQLVAERDQLKKSLKNSQITAVRLQAKFNTLSAKHKSFDAVTSRQEKRIESLSEKLVSAESMAERHKDAQRKAEKRELAQREKAELVAKQRDDTQRQKATRVARQAESVQKDAASGAIKDPPTLVKRAPIVDQDFLSSAESGMIPDDQIIPILPEAEMTANVEAYELSDLEQLVDQDV